VPVTDCGDSPTVLLEILNESRQAGFLGPGPVEPHLHHAEGFAVLARRLHAVSPTDGAEAAPRLVDLGSGGGLPGLVVATRWPEAFLILLDANERRTEFLERAIFRLSLGDRVAVVQERAEVYGRDPQSRASFDGVVARSFGAPGVVAECGAPLLKVGGWMIISEPPEISGTAAGTQVPTDASGAASSRWPAPQLAEFGLEPGAFVTEGFGYQVLHQISPCPDRFPRRNGVPAKNPLF